MSLSQIPCRLNVACDIQARKRPLGVVTLSHCSHHQHDPACAARAADHRAPTPAGTTKATPSALARTHMPALRGPPRRPWPGNRPRLPAPADLPPPPLARRGRPAPTRRPTARNPSRQPRHRQLVRRHGLTAVTDRFPQAQALTQQWLTSDGPADLKTHWKHRLGLLGQDPYGARTAPALTASSWAKCSPLYGANELAGMWQGFRTLSGTRPKRRKAPRLGVTSTG